MACALHNSYQNQDIAISRSVFDCGRLQDAIPLVLFAFTYELTYEFTSEVIEKRREPGGRY